MKKLAFFLVAIITSTVAFSQESVEPADLQFADELDGKSVIIKDVYILADSQSIEYQSNQLADLYMLWIYDDNRKLVSARFGPNTGPVANVVTSRKIARQWLRFRSDNNISNESLRNVTLTGRIVTERLYGSSSAVFFVVDSIKAWSGNTGDVLFK